MITQKAKIMELIKKIELYKTMAKEHNDIVPDVADVNYRIANLSIEDIKMVSEHYGKPLKPVIGLKQVFVGLSFDNCHITCFSVECEYTTSVELTPISDLQKQVA